MGYNSSLITINNLPAEPVSDSVILEHIGLGDYEADGVAHGLNLCPGWQSIWIGYYNNHLVLADDCTLTGKLDYYQDFERLLPYEAGLTRLFPHSEILTTACASAANANYYSLVKEGQRLRYKCIASGYDRVEYGVRLPEEEAIYATSSMVNGELLFKNKQGDYEYTEDCLMEDFTFGVAKRHLGVTLHMDIAEDLYVHTEFRKYRKPKEAAALNDLTGGTAIPPVPAPPLPKQNTPPVSNGKGWLGGVLRKLGLKK